MGLKPKAAWGGFPGVAGTTLGQQPTVVDGPAKSIECGGVYGDLYRVVQIAVFHFAQQSKELMLGEAAEGLEVREAIFAKVPSMKSPAKLTRDTNW